MAALSFAFAVAANTFKADVDIFCHKGQQLPSLFIIGAAKCGTTTMATTLEMQFGVQGPKSFQDGLFELANKEAHFFNDPLRMMRGLTYFASVFPSCSNATLSMDATPVYMADVLSMRALVAMYGPERVARTTFVSLLCDPVERAQADFYHFHHSTPQQPNDLAEYTYPKATTAEAFGSLVNRLRTVDEIDHLSCEENAPAMCAIGTLSASKHQYLNISAALDSVGHLVVIPASLFFHNSASVLDLLLALVRQRSGKDLVVPSRKKLHSTDPINVPIGVLYSGSEHPKLADEGIEPRAAKLLQQYYHKSIQQVYSVLNDPRVTTIPSRFEWRNLPINESHWLETSSVLTGSSVPTSLPYKSAASEQAEHALLPSL